VAVTANGQDEHNTRKKFKFQSPWVSAPQKAGKSQRPRNKHNTHKIGCREIPAIEKGIGAHLTPAPTEVKEGGE